MITHRYKYLMENDDESFRLELKTDAKTINKQALWAGISSGMNIVDIGCGSGKSTFCLNKLIQPKGNIIGLDFSENRIDHAKKHYSGNGINYICRDIFHPLNDLGQFDFIWVRFILEYYRSNSYEIVKNISKILKPGGILCLIDLDYNCLSHFPPTPKFENAIFGMIKNLEKDANFDPYAGRKLYSYLYDLGYQNIDVNVEAHHLIFGNLNEKDEYNWTKKLQVASDKSGYQFHEYRGGSKEFFEEFKTFFSDPRRFTYTPVISCRGYKPMK